MRWILAAALVCACSTPTPAPTVAPPSKTKPAATAATRTTEPGPPTAATVIAVASESAKDIAADPFIQVSAGSTTCALRKSGRVFCFSEDDPLLRPVAGIDSAVYIVASPAKYVCAALRTGNVRCVDLDLNRKEVMTNREPAITDATKLYWDMNVCAIRKDGTTQCFQPFDKQPPRAGPFGKGVQHLALGESHSCMLRTNGELFCAGSNGRGQLGRGAKHGMQGGDDIIPAGPDGDVRAPVSKAIAVAAGSEHTCAVVTGGKVTCWGTHYQGALGVGDKDVAIGVPQTVPGIDRVVEIESFSWSTCVRHDGGQVSCWGTNSAGELGDGTLTDRESPIKVTLPSAATDISVGHLRVCATLADGRVSCWGAHSRSAPAKLGLTDVISLAADEDGTCARKKDGSTWCWGHFGILRGKAFAAISAPKRFAELDSLRELAFVTHDYDWRVCGLTKDDVACFTLPSRGGEVTEIAAQPRSLSSAKLGKVNNVSVYGNLNCVAGSTGDARCFHGVPGKVFALPGLKGATHVHSVIGAVCGINKRGGVDCVGRRSKNYDAAEELGGNAVEVPGVTAAIALDGTGPAMCALQRPGTIACWEYDERTESVTYVEKIEGITDAISMAMGGPPCAVRKQGEVTCFDLAGKPELRSIKTLHPPRRIAGITDAVQIVAGDKHACVLHRDATVSCWGDNQYGQLGDGRGAGSIWFVPVAAP